MQNKNTILAVVIIIIILVLLGYWYLTVFKNPTASINSITATSSSTAATSSTTNTKVVYVPVTQTVTHTVVINSTTPTISSFTPSGGAPVSTTVTIHGTNFSKTSNTIYFGPSDGLYYKDGRAENAIATGVASPDGTTLTFTVPAETPSGILCNTSNQCTSLTARTVSPGVYPLQVQNANGTSAAVNFIVIQ